MSRILGTMELVIGCVLPACVIGLRMVQQLTGNAALLCKDLAQEQLCGKKLIYDTLLASPIVAQLDGEQVEKVQSAFSSCGAVPEKA